MAKIQRAIISCYDKTGVVDLARLLVEFGVELISTSGTLEVLQQAGIPAISISDFIGVPELMDGRVKSLHSRVHAGLLGIRDNKLHQEQLQEHGLQWIDLLVANQRPLVELSTRPNIEVEEFLDQVDIGGTAMIRSAAKNFRYVTVVTNVQRYPLVMHELRAHEGEVSYQLRYKLAHEAFQTVAQYDQLCAEFLRKCEPPET